MYKIDWSGKSYNYSSKDFKILLKKLTNLKVLSGKKFKNF